jgi:hypothetical protein
MPGFPPYRRQLSITDRDRVVSGFPVRRPGFGNWPCGIYGERNGTGVCFLRFLQFPVPILIPPSAPHSLPILSSTVCSLDIDSVVK